MSTTDSPQSTACILCNQNCGILVHQDQEGNFTKIVGDEQHPVSEGYLCQKATRLNYYQKQERLTSPLRKKADGSFEEISWDTAIKEIAEKLVQIRDNHGGKSIAYAGGGGQGNHIGGVFGAMLRSACETPYIYASLAQEKTGNFWVNGHLFGRQNTNYCEPVAEAEFVMILGANPIQAHGIPKARPTINEVSRNPKKTLVVVDPRQTETAKKADIFLQVKAGKDAFLLSALLGHIIQNELQDKVFLRKRTVGFEEVKPYFLKIDVGKYAEMAGISHAQVIEVAEGIASADSFALRSDLGIEQSHNSTLNSYLARLLFLVTGNFGKEGTNCLHTALFPLIGHSKEPEAGGITTQVTKMKGIGKLFPPNILPLEIDTDHPDRIRALIVDSANPVTNYANSAAQRKAIEKLELSVVIEVAMTETALAAQYVLPAQTQYEKMEATFFNLEFPENFFHLRHPISEPLSGTLDEPEIYHKLVTAMGEIPRSFPLLSAIAKLDRRFPTLKLLPLALQMTIALRPKWKKYQLLILKETMGKALPYDYAKSAVFIWTACHMYVSKYEKQVRRTGFQEKGYALGEALFNKILHSKSGTLISKHTFDESWELIRHKDKKVHLEIPEMLEWLEALPEKAHEEVKRGRKYPFNLLAGERRSYNANAVMRNPEWRKKDLEGVLKINPLDAETEGIENGSWVKCISPTGEILIKTQLTKEVPQGLLSMPHGYGFTYPEHDHSSTGALANALTSLEDCDPLAKTPYHKNVRVRLEKV
ncbi:MAG: molybdopterin-dependent oxidoreductase [Bacteroidia bacterium]|nr:molybdopterin-dependent oxidoreductase [Bacteroidia bacterium]